MEPIPDTIERSILIHAPADRVWALVSEPGWWINDGQIRAHQLSQDPDRPGITVVTDPEYGDFTIETVSATEPESIVYRWLGGQEDSAAPVVSTQIRFTLEATSDGTLLRVVESGWASVEPSEQVRTEYRGNEEGWDQELAAARTQCEQQ